MFAAYWPVMAFVAGIILVLSVIMVSMSKLCRARLDPLPERDLTTYLQDDVSNYSEACYIISDAICIYFQSEDTIISLFF